MKNILLVAAVLVGLGVAACQADAGGFGRRGVVVANGGFGGSRAFVAHNGFGANRAFFAPVHRFGHRPVFVNQFGGFHGNAFRVNRFGGFNAGFNAGFGGAVFVPNRFASPFGFSTFGGYAF